MGKKEKKGGTATTGAVPAGVQRERFGARMMQARREKGWSQAQLGIASGYDVRAISRYENDGAIPSIEAAARLAKALGVSLDVLGGLSAPAADVQLYALMQQCLALPQEETAALKRLLKAWLEQG